MAEGILKTLADDQFEVYSAGAKATLVHPLATRVMTEAGIDILGHRSKSVAEFAGQEFDLVVTLCGDTARDVCPSFVGEVEQRLHWNFPDPAEAQGSDEEKLEVFRKVRDQIKARLEEFVKESGDE
jgi:arsenate reductase